MTSPRPSTSSRLCTRSAAGRRRLVRSRRTCRGLRALHGDAPRIEEALRAWRWRHAAVPPPAVKTALRQRVAAEGSRASRAGARELGAWGAATGAVAAVAALSPAASSPPGTRRGWGRWRARRGRARAPAAQRADLREQVAVYRNAVELLRDRPRAWSSCAAPAQPGGERSSHLARHGRRSALVATCHRAGRQGLRAVGAGAPRKAAGTFQVDAAGRATHRWGRPAAPRASSPSRSSPSPAWRRRPARSCSPPAKLLEASPPRLVRTNRQGVDEWQPSQRSFTSTSTPPFPPPCAGGNRPVERVRPGEPAWQHHGLRRRHLALWERGTGSTNANLGDGTRVTVFLRKPPLREAGVLPKAVSLGSMERPGFTGPDRSTRRSGDVSSSRRNIAIPIGRGSRSSSRSTAPKTWTASHSISHESLRGRLPQRVGRTRRAIVRVRLAPRTLA